MAKILRAQVRSTALRDVSYDADARILTVTFQRGATATYPKVPRAVFDAMIKAPSVGRYYRQVIQARFGRNGRGS